MNCCKGEKDNTMLYIYDLAVINYMTNQKWKLKKKKNSDQDVKLFLNDYILRGF